MVGIVNLNSDELDNQAKKEAKWYILQTYSGFENYVKNNLLKLADSMNMLDLIIDVISPRETYIEIKNDGKKKEKERQMYVGYLFVKMIITDRSLNLVKNTPRVNGFLGVTDVNSKPIPLKEDEINPILAKIGLISKKNYDYLSGRKVEIITGSFSGQIGKVLNVENQHEKVTVEIDLFGRSTPIEISFSQFKEIN